MRFLLAFAAVASATEPEATGPSNVVQLGGKTWHQTDQGLTLVKFYAPWCGHCKRMAPAYERVARQYNGGALVTIAKVDGTAFPGLLKRYNIAGYPTVVLFSNGRRRATYKGPRTYEGIVQFVEAQLAEADSDGASEGEGSQRDAPGDRRRDFRSGSSWKSVDGSGAGDGRLAAVVARLLSIELDLTTVVVAVLCGALTCSAGLVALLLLTPPARR